VEILVCGLALAHDVDLAEAEDEVLGCRGVLGAARHAGSERVMRPIERGDATHPGVTPRTKDLALYSQSDLDATVTASTRCPDRSFTGAQQQSATVLCCRMTT